ncbi:cytoskeletal protein CcmA (bactofilin family) [Neobacillus niacini]|uniref:polymer-forming cytoskeletal protein n=1 Tax=Neobacillus niacini TaxID=86668 RepID=UPI0028573DF6|nr:polymer-forming cytoskeletal protein [Neobacillus niacini]MDR7080175.1 cytoskeletal protein CcmA (bactofilin family) [Neobacillus niacini]
METKKRGDLIINGLGSSNGGQFNEVTLNGKGTVNSDVECTNFDCNGLGTVNGNLAATTANISGNGKINGSIEGQSLSIDGTAKVKNNVIVKNLEVSGKTSVGGKIKSEDIKIKGRITVGEDCEAETFKAESHFTIGGLLNADLIDITIFSDCKAKEIGGQTILIKQKATLFGLFLPFIQTQLETELIEGDRIEIENTKADIVRGNNVTIGPNCTIGIVEYSGELSLDEKAVVKEIRKV